MRQDLDQPPVVPPGGTHLLIDLLGCERLDDLDHVSQVCRNAAVATGATVIGENFHHFGEGCGVSGVVLLAESHLTLHSWAENGYAAADVFVCGSCDATKAYPVLVDGFAAKDTQVVLVRRGESEATRKLSLHIDEKVQI